MFSFGRCIPPLFVALGLTVSCTKKGTDYGLDIKDTFRMNLMQEPPTLDWAKSTDTTSSTVLFNLMDTLVDYNLEDPELGLKPALASEWKPSENGRIWTFTLRPGVKWTDGVALTAQQFVDGWERLLNPATAAEYAYFLFAVKNAKNYNSGQLKDFKQVGVKVNDQGQIVVELEKPMSYFPMLVTHTATMPGRKDLVEKFGEKWTSPENIQTLGPYRLKLWDHDKALVLERYEGYWGEKAKTKNVLGLMINEYSTALNLYNSGKLDFQETIPALELGAYKDKPGFRLAKALSTFYLGFNVHKAPFDDVRVRKAFDYAIDRQQIVDLLSVGHVPLSGWIPVGMFGYEPTVGLKFDAEKARALLDEAGFKDRSHFPKIAISLNTNENYQRVAENIQAQLKKVLGLDLEVHNEEWKVYLNRLHNDTPMFYRMGWLADYPDPDNFMNLMTSYSDNNYGHWANKKYDDLIVQGAAEIDKEKRRSIYREAQKILTEDDVPVVPIYSMVVPLLLSDRVQGLPLNSLNRWVFKGVTLK